MASFKITLLVLAVLGMAQGHSLAKRATFNPLDFIGSAEQSMANALKTINATSAEIVTAVDAAKAKLTGYINIAKAAQANAEQAARAQIQAIVTNATAAAANQTGSKACLTVKVAEVEKLGLDTILNVINCLGKKVTELENMLQTVVDTGDKALTMIPQAILDVNKCHDGTQTNGFVVVWCDMTATASLVGKVNDVVAKVTGVVAQATTLVSTLQTDLTSCATFEVGKMGLQAAMLVAKFAVCAITSG